MWLRVVCMGLMGDCCMYEIAATIGTQRSLALDVRLVALLYHVKILTGLFPPTLETLHLSRLAYIKHLLDHSNRLSSSFRNTWYR